VHFSAHPLKLFRIVPYNIFHLGSFSVADHSSNSRYETDFGVFSACGAENTKIGFLKANQRLAFKKPIFIMRIAVITGCDRIKIRNLQ